MSLSRMEARSLARIEELLCTDDPAFVRRFTSTIEHAMPPKENPGNSAAAVPLLRSRLRVVLAVVALCTVFTVMCAFAAADPTSGTAEGDRPPPRDMPSSAPVAPRR